MTDHGNTPNQDNIDALLRVPYVLERMHRYLRLTEQSNKCVVPHARFCRSRQAEDGKTIRASYRHLLWRLSRGPGTAPVFHTPSCGVAGCIHPAHQRTFSEVQKERDVGRKPFVCDTASPVL